MIRGIFGPELGEDFFGLKDLGLDKELNTCILQVPSKVWFGNDNQKLNTVSRERKGTFII
jgi:hypothetical protein